MLDDAEKVMATFGLDFLKRDMKRTGNFDAVSCRLYAMPAKFFHMALGAHKLSTMLRRPI